MVVKKFYRGERFQCGDIAATSHYHVGFTPTIVAGPLPNPQSRSAMLDGLIHVEPLGSWLFPCHNDIDVIPTPQAVIGN